MAHAANSLGLRRGVGVGQSSSLPITPNHQANPGSSMRAVSYNVFLGQPSMMSTQANITEASQANVAHNFMPTTPNVQIPEQDGAADSSDMLAMTTVNSMSTVNSLVTIDSPTSGSGSALSDTPTENDIPEAHISEGVFTIDEDWSRSLLIQHVAPTITSLDLTRLVNPTRYPSFRELDADRIVSHGNVYASFDDLNDSKNAFNELSLANTQWIVKYIKARAYAAKDPEKDLEHVSDYEGHIVIFAHFDQCAYPRPSPMKFFQDVRNFAAKFGAIKAFFSPPSSAPHLKKIYVEYFDELCADQAVLSVQATIEGPVALNCKHHRPDIKELRPTVPSITPGPTMDGPGFAPGHLNSGSNSLPSHALGYGPGAGPQYPNQYMFPSAGRRQRLSVTRPGFGSDRFNLRLSPQGYELSKFREYEAVNHNHVDIANIANGIDVRTTIMLRNIPNCVDQSQLKFVLDQTSRGQYDFMYLRIDFGNNKNVGYAFINFSEPMSIITFAQARAGHRWGEILAGANIHNVNPTGSRHHVDKVAAISYATIQGRDCLIQKFRNSSVMLEHPMCRPKLYITLTGPNCGDEEPFPAPDNPSKMRRSVENAEHVGLFAPRAGQQYRDEQRRRRSQYDRGTTAAEYEAYMEGHVDPARKSIAPPRIMSAPTQMPGFYHYE